jgi:hypothetical protein
LAARSALRPGKLVFLRLITAVPRSRCVISTIAITSRQRTIEAGRARAAFNPRKI